MRSLLVRGIPLPQPVDCLLSLITVFCDNNLPWLPGSVFGHIGMPPLWFISMACSSLPCLQASNRHTCCVYVFFPDGWPDSVREVTSYSLSRDSSSLASLPTNLPEVKPSAIFDSTLKLLSMDLTKACRSCCSSIPLEAVKYLLRCPGNSLSQTPQ